MTKSLYERLLPAPVNGGFRMQEYWVWCGSVVQGDDGYFHMFASRWPKHLPMHPGWMVHSEVVRAVSATPEGPYAFMEVVLPARGAQYWDGRSTFNPHIVKHNGKYLLFYAGTTHPFSDVRPGDAYDKDDPRCIVARSNKRIGLAVADRVEGPWIRRDDPILDVRPGKFDSYLTSNPAPYVHDNGSVLLIYKSRTYQGHTYSNMALGAAWADHYEGPYRVLSEQPIFPPEQIHLEDPFIWRTGDGYSMIAKDMNGNVCHERHGGIQAFSEDGVNWQMTENPKAYSRLVAWDDGTKQLMGNFERPFLLFQEGEPTHLFGATADGVGDFKGKSTWNMVIPIK
jgi:hypothetical protein